MIQKLIAIAAWACWVFIVFATLSSIDARPELTGPGLYQAFFTVFERFAAYVALGFLFSLAYPRNIALVCLLVFGSAVILELLQALTPDRHGRILDAVEKLAGGAAGILSRQAILAFSERQQPSRSPRIR
jgi:VanZ family protein